ncbi:MAG: 23S rRNA (uracil(1939)-C(5))-methyltransferase RlmD [Flavobacteriaceae bacterium]
MRKKRPRQLFERLEVLDTAAKGKAVAKAPDGRTVFVTNAVPGDMVDVLTTKKRKAYFEAEATHFHRFSEKRVEARCEHFGICGGCKWQHMGYEHQLFYKQKEVTNNLKRIGHLDFPDSLPIIGAPEQYEYRNKLEFSFSDNRWLTREEIASPAMIGDRNALGFHIPGMWDKILDINHCHLQQAPSNEIRLEIKRFAIEKGLTFFSPRGKTGLLRTLMIRRSSIGELMVLIQFFEDDPAAREVLLSHIYKTFPQIDSLLYVVNNKANDTIYDQEIVCYEGKDHIIEQMDELEFRITAKSFYQTNSEQAYNLYKVVKNFAALQEHEVVYDLYTGTGTIACFLARLASKVVGIDFVPEAIEAASYNAANNGISNTLFFAGDMKDIFNDTFIVQNGKPDVVVTDPPREGMHKNVVQQLLKLGPPRIVYVSCNSATQARDLALMSEDYEIKKVQPVDMFPQTHHVENVVLLEKRIPQESDSENEA